MPKQQPNSVIIQRNKPLLLVGMVATYLVVDGMSFLIRRLCKGTGSSVWQICGEVCCDLWLLYILVLGIFALWHGGQRLILDDLGVQWSFVFWRRRMTWEQIRDWGVSCKKQIFWEGGICICIFFPGAASFFKKFREEIFDAIRQDFYS